LVFAVSALLYSTLWMAAVRSTPELPGVELGFDFSYLPEERVVLVTGVRNGSPAEKAGMLAADRIFAINGVRIEDSSSLYKVYYQHQPGDTVQFTIERSGQPAPVFLTGLFRPRPLVDSGGLIGLFAEQINDSFPVPFLIVGLTVLLLRFEDRNAWLLALLFASFTAAPGFPKELPVAQALRPFAMVYKTVFLSMLGPLFYSFFAVFPVRSPLDRRLPWLKWASIAVGISFTLSGLRAGEVWLPPPLHAMMGEKLSAKITFVFLFTFLALGLVSLALNFKHAHNPEVRRKIRVIFWGSGVGMVPVLIQTGVENFLGFRTPLWLSTTIVVLLFLFPLSFAYAVIKHRVLEIPVLIKRSARYLLVQRGFTVLLSLVSIGMTLVIAFSLSRYAQSAVNITKPFAIALGAALGTVLLWLGTQIHKRVSAKIDRAFFRSAYDARVILENLAERSATAIDRRELVHLLEHHLTQALQPSSLVVYLRGNDDWLEAVSGAVPDQLQSLSSKLPILTEMTKRGQPSEFPLAMHDGNAEISALHPECLVPMMGRGKRLVGCFVLGPRLADEPYSGEDKRLLSSVAIQAATALENMRLAEEIAERKENEMRVIHEMEISRRLLEADNARKTKELEEARALQLSMLPSSLPVLAHLDIAVHIQTATEVGGDYYDFLVDPNGALTVAIGDATGHGIKAGIMVASIKSLFTAFGSAPDMPIFFNKCSQIIKGMHLGNLYMAMILAKINGRHMTVSAAGMPPVLIYRNNTGAVEELLLKGMPLGGPYTFDYPQRQTELHPGDTILFMSDGYPELFNEKDEMLDYPRITEIFREAAPKPAAEVIDHLWKAGEAWANGNSLRDDTTLLVIKVKQRNDHE
jgi:sigma-B regulation protein RsbU (phosphoserine phosphatase)